MQRLAGPRVPRHLEDHELAARRPDLDLLAAARVGGVVTVTPPSEGVAAATHIYVAAFLDSLAAAGFKNDVSDQELVEKCLAPRLERGNVPLRAGDRIEANGVEFKVIDVDTALTASDEKGGVVPEGGCEIVVEEERLLRSQEVDEIGYDDLGGIDKAVATVRELVEAPLKRPEFFEAVGVAPPRGVLLHGAPGCGKSSFVNRAVGAYSGGQNYKGVKSWGVTASASPGTTLGVVKINLRDDGPDVYDTPGLLQPGALGTVLTEEELQAITPKKLDVVTLRVGEGQCVLLGGLARVEVVDAPLGAFFLTFYVAPTLTLHPTSAKNADAAFREKHAGGLLSPPFDSERVAELGDFESHTVEIDGRGFEGAAADVTLAGLGWLAVYGSGRCSLRVSALPGVAVSTREPLLPFEDLRRTTAKFTGGRVLRGQSKAKGKKPSRRRRR